MKKNSKNIATVGMSLLMLVMSGCGEVSNTTESLKKNENVNSGQAVEEESFAEEEYLQEDYGYVESDDESSWEYIPESSSNAYSSSESSSFEIEYVVEPEYEVETESEVPACNDNIPYGMFSDYGEANQFAQNRLDELADADWDHWNQGGYYVNTYWTDCGTPYYDVSFYRWEGNTKVFE